jgi:nuclear transport factor 2 (NTF2) superfamily protein
LIDYEPVDSHCPICSEWVYNKDMLRRHVEKAHDAEQIVNFLTKKWQKEGVCPICERGI